MRIKNRDKLNLIRFGCTFWPKQKAICIPWVKTLRVPDIVARLLYTQLASGPLLSLAFEVSVTKALAWYCFFPFDLKNTIHRTYLSSVFEEGKIHLCFLGDTLRIVGTHDLLPSRIKKMAELYATAIADLKKFPSDKYDFDRTVIEFEQTIRLVDHFEYVISETELQRLIASFGAQAAKASPEDRAQATKLANELLGVFRSRPEGFIREQIEQLSSVRRALLFLSDLHRRFADDYNGFAQFVADAIAAHTPKEDNRQLETLIPLLESIFRLMDHLGETPAGDEKTSAARETEFRDIMNRMATQGPSFERLKSIASILGFQGGRPGRPLKDYSAEYELRAAGKKWREVTEYNLQNDPETRQEFGGRKFDELSLQERSTLMHRIRVGVGAFAKRTRTSIPSRTATKLLPPRREEQEKPP